MLTVTQRTVLGGKVRTPGYRVPYDLEAECRQYPPEVWQEQAEGGEKEAKGAGDKLMRGTRTKAAS